MKKRTKVLIEDAIEGLKSRALEAKAADDRQQAVFAEEDAAELALLERVIEAARPGFPTIMDRIEGLPLPAVSIFTGVYLYEDGTFAEWTVGPKPCPLALVEVLADYEPMVVAMTLADLFARQVDGRGASASGVALAIAKLRAVVTLLG